MVEFSIDGKRVGATVRRMATLAIRVFDGVWRKIGKIEVSGLSTYAAVESSSRRRRWLSRVRLGG